MRLIAILCWYDEEPTLLTQCVESLAVAEVDHLVAVDGAYEAYPDGKPRSSLREVLAITNAASRAGISYTLATTPQLWANNEIEKRSWAFAAAELSAQRGDWYMVVDADHQILEAPSLKRRLAIEGSQAVEVTLTERGHDHRFRCLYRAQPGIRVQHNHYTYTLPDGTRLWNGPHGQHVPATYFQDVVVAHHSNVSQAKRIYWDQRNEVMAP